MQFSSHLLAVLVVVYETSDFKIQIHVQLEARNIDFTQVPLASV